MKGIDLINFILEGGLQYTEVLPLVTYRGDSRIFDIQEVKYDVKEDIVVLDIGEISNVY